MRYFPLILVLPLSVVLPLISPSVVNSQDRFNPNSSSPSFWPEAQELVQQQLYVINQIKRSLSSPNINDTEGSRSRLFLQVGRVERFLERQYRIPVLLCNPDGTVASDVPAELTVPQRQVYCALYTSTQQLKPMISLLDRRLPMLAGLAAPNPIPPSNPQPGLRLNLDNPIRPEFSSVPDFPEPEPPVIGIPAKTANVDEDTPPLPPAIAPSEPVLTTLAIARRQILNIVPTLPDSAQIIDPDPNAAIIAQGTYDLLPLQSQPYAQFLAQPHTGIAHILLAETYHPDPNQLRNRIKPPVLEQFPFVPLADNPRGSLPRLALEIAGENVQIPMLGADYGFIVNLGTIALDHLDPTLKNLPNLSPEQRDLFLNYRPPQQLDALQLEQRRLLTGKEGVGAVPPPSLTASTNAPVVLHSTYLIRLIQFQLPEVLLTREPISRAQRRNLPDILKTPSSDVLVAVQPVYRHLDGSYTVLWRFLYRFPDPVIDDLDEYVELE